MARNTKTAPNYAQRQRRRERRILTNIPIHIGTQLPPRKLRASARRELEKERTRNSWICPWISEPTYRLSSQGALYPAASFLGLPAELRQKVLSDVLDVRALVGSIEKVITATEGSCAKVVRKLVGELSCVSPIVRYDMTYVRELWLRKLNALLDTQSRGATENPLLQDSSGGQNQILGAWTKGRRKNGKVLVAKEAAQCQGRRQKCWRCAERHGNGDKVCGMARREPERWMRLSKPVQRGSEAAGWGELFGVKKIRFDD